MRDHRRAAFRQATAITQREHDRIRLLRNNILKGQYAEALNLLVLLLLPSWTERSNDLRSLPRHPENYRRRSTAADTALVLAIQVGLRRHGDRADQPINLLQDILRRCDVLQRAGLKPSNEEAEHLDRAIRACADIISHWQKKRSRRGRPADDARSETIRKLVFFFQANAIKPPYWKRRFSTSLVTFLVRVNNVLRSEPQRRHPAAPLDDLWNERLLATSDDALKAALCRKDRRRIFTEHELIALSAPARQIFWSVPGRVRIRHAGGDGVHCKGP